MDTESTFVKGEMRKNMEARRKELILAVKMAGREQSSANVRLLNTIGAQLGLSINDEKALDILNQYGPLTAGAIAEHTGLATPSVTALIDRLEKKDFVRRVRDPEDRRRVIVTLNPQRFAELYALFGSLVHSMDEMLAPYSDEQLLVILDFLGRSSQFMRAEASRLNQESRAKSPTP